MSEFEPSENYMALENAANRSALALHVAELLEDDDLRISVYVHGAGTDAEIIDKAEKVYELALKENALFPPTQRVRNGIGGLTIETKGEVSGGAAFDITFFGPHKEAA